MAEWTKRMQKVAQRTPQNTAFFKQLTVIPLLSIFTNLMELKDRDINEDE
jgi:hypothetical protein